MGGNDKANQCIHPCFAKYNMAIGVARETNIRQVR